MKHILMVCYGGGHMKVLAPLYSSLASEYRVTVLALTTAGAYMEQQGIPYLSFKDFAFVKAQAIQSYGRELFAAIPGNNAVPEDESVAYLGASFFDLVGQVDGEADARELFRDKGRASFLPVASLKKIIEELDVDFVIATNAPRAERAALIAAKDIGLSTVSISDNLWIHGGIADVARGNLADKICVLSGEVKNRLISETNIAPEKVVVTGTPVFDEVKSIPRVPGIRPRVPRVLLADHSLPKHHPFLDISNGFLGTDEDIRVELNRLADSGDIEVFLRSHPSEHIDYSRYGACRVSPSEENLYERLSKTDVVVTAISTVGVEGKVMGLGLVSLEDTVFSTRESYERIGLSSGIRRPSELRWAIYREFSRLKRYSSCDLYEGLAKDNIVSEIKRMVG